MNNPLHGQQDPSLDPDALPKAQNDQPLPSPGMKTSSTVPDGMPQPETQGQALSDQNFSAHESAHKVDQSTNQQATIPAESLGVTENWLSKEIVEELRTRWNSIQFQFVDSPCSAVEQGDALIADVIEQITQSFSTIQNSLNQLWLNRDDISTEELRYTLQQYRSVLNRLLNL
jgi:hypothetical protein